MILIDLPMPEACNVCPFNYDFCWCNAFGNRDEWEKYSDDWNVHVCDRNNRPEYCPLKESVRCKDCKWKKWVDVDDEVVCCGLYDFTRDMNWFCADGERKDL